MAHPRKHSRLITVGGQVFRWHVDINEDSADEKILSVYPDEDPNGARLAMTLNNHTIPPSLVRRLILVGMRLGYVPHDRAKSRIIQKAEHVSEILHDYPRVILHNGVEYTWTPESRGGLHIKVRRSDSPQGQLLATFATLKPDQLNERFVSQAIDAALREGWKPADSGIDCHWLDAAECSRILAEL